MRLLALDTSSLACSVALLSDSVITECYEEKPREHTRIVMPMIKQLLSDAATSLRDLDAIVLGNGPGSFIGMRIGASVAQGMAHGSGLAIIPVSSLAAVASQVLADTTAEAVVVAQDAHMQQVYLGLYSRGSDDSPLPLCDERLQDLSAVPELAKVTGVYAAGAGWQQYPQLLAANSPRLASHSPLQFPRASQLIRLATMDAAIDPAALEPAYLRQTVARKSVRLDS